MGQLPKTLRETIKNITKTHLIEKNGLAMGQCLTVVVRLVERYQSCMKIKEWWSCQWQTLQEEGLQ